MIDEPNQDTGGVAAATTPDTTGCSRRRGTAVRHSGR